MMEKQEKKARDIFQRYLKNKRMVLTVPREIILRTVFTMPPHFTADELAERLKEGEDRVSRGTIYRTLHFLEEAGIIRNLREPPSSNHYEFALGLKHHNHLICESCGKIIEFLDQDIERLQRKVCRREKFIAGRHPLQIFGLCRECSEKIRGGEKQI